MLGLIRDLRTAKVVYVPGQPGLFQVMTQYTLRPSLEEAILDRDSARQRWWR